MSALPGLGALSAADLALSAVAFEDAPPDRGPRFGRLSLRECFGAGGLVGFDLEDSRVPIPTLPDDKLGHRVVLVWQGAAGVGFAAVIADRSRPIGGVLRSIPLERRSANAAPSANPGRTGIIGGHLSCSLAGRT